MYSNQSWPPVISPLGIHPCFRNATRAKQGCCRDWQGHTVFVSIVDELAYEDRHIRCLQVGWGSTSPDLLAGLLSNDLEAAASALLPQILSALSAGRVEDALAGIMTGSGTTCAFLARDHGHAESLASVVRTGGIFRSVMVTNGPVEGVRVMAQSAA
jgi:4-diphosphocytidyl-2C-methyl-D-erythritol kinase